MLIWCNRKRDRCKTTHQRIKNTPWMPTKCNSYKLLLENFFQLFTAMLWGAQRWMDMKNGSILPWISADKIKKNQTKNNHYQQPYTALSHFCHLTWFLSCCCCQKLWHSNICITYVYSTQSFTGLLRSTTSSGQPFHYFVFPVSHSLVISKSLGR